MLQALPVTVNLNGHKVDIPYPARQKVQILSGIFLVLILSLEDLNFELEFVFLFLWCHKKIFNFLSNNSQKKLRTSQIFIQKV
jgi:hypothetical protein